RRKRNRKTTETRERNDDGEVALMAYATESDLADYLGVSLADLPPDADRLLKRASEDIDYWTLGRAMQCEATKLAACAQVEMWLEVGEETDIRGALASFSIGSWSATYAG